MWDFLGKICNFGGTLIWERKLKLVDRMLILGNEELIGQTWEEKGDINGALILGSWVPYILTPALINTRQYFEGLQHSLEWFLVSSRQEILK